MVIFRLRAFQSALLKRYLSLFSWHFSSPTVAMHHLTTTFARPFGVGQTVHPIRSLLLYWIIGDDEIECIFRLLIKRVLINVTICCRSMSSRASRNLVRWFGPSRVRRNVTVSSCTSFNVYRFILDFRQVKVAVDVHNWALKGFKSSFGCLRVAIMISLVWRW